MYAYSGESLPFIKEMTDSLSTINVQLTVDLSKALSTKVKLGGVSFFMDRSHRFTIGEPLVSLTSNKILARTCDATVAAL